MKQLQGNPVRQEW